MYSFPDTFNQQPFPDWWITPEGSHLPRQLPSGWSLENNSMCLPAAQGIACLPAVVA